MMKYIAFIDILGTKNSSKNNLEEYLNSVVNFQSALVRNIEKLKGVGRIHFFSDCAYLESQQAHQLVEFIKAFRDELMDSNIYIKGAIIKGKLGAISGSETENWVKDNYGDVIFKKFNNLSKKYQTYKETISGTVFFSADIGIAYHFQDELKGIGVVVQNELLAELNDEIVTSGYVIDSNKLTYQQFHDLSYNDSLISENYIDNIIRNYIVSNIYNINFGRYYISILISFIRSSDMTEVSYDEKTHGFFNTPPIFEIILSLKKKYKRLYNSAIGLEYVFFALINKLYDDLERSDTTTQKALQMVLTNEKFMTKYLNKLSSITPDVIAKKNRAFLVKDYYDLIKEGKI